MIKTFFVEFGHTDSQHDKLMPGVFKDLPKKVLLTKDFDHTKPIGQAEVFYDDHGAIKATAEINDNLMPLYPAIGFQILDKKVENGVTVINEAKLEYIGLCQSPNVDPNIKALKDQ